MNKVKGITVGTYLTKTIKNSKDKGLSSKEICNLCKMKDKCKYRQITKFENGKVVEVIAKEGKEMLEAITACKVSKEKEIEQTEVYEDECWDDYDGETIGS